MDLSQATSGPTLHTLQPLATWGLLSPSPGRSHEEGCSKCLQERESNDPPQFPYSRTWTEGTAGDACLCHQSLCLRNYIPLGTTNRKKLSPRKVIMNLVINLKQDSLSQGALLRYRVAETSAHLGMTPGLFGITFATKIVHIHHI